MVMLGFLDPENSNVAPGVILRLWRRVRQAAVTLESRRAKAFNRP
jgi:hypothetical protein